MTLWFINWSHTRIQQKLYAFLYFKSLKMPNISLSFLQENIRLPGSFQWHFQRDVNNGGRKDHSYAYFSKRLLLNFWTEIMEVEVTLDASDPILKQKLKGMMTIRCGKLSLNYHLVFFFFFK